MSTVLRRLVFTTHVTSSVAWVGAVIVFMALAVLGLSSQHEPTVRGAYLVMAPAAWFVLVPLAHASLLSGIAISLGTPWGLLRYYWVVAKLAITLVATIVLMVYMKTFREMATVAADPVADLGLVRNPSPMVHAILALVLLLVATVLAIYKPFGMTQYGRLRQQEQGRSRPTTVSSPMAPDAATAASNWLYLGVVLAAAVILAFVVMHFLGGGVSH